MGASMLKRIQRIKGIGLLHDANGGAHAFEKATLIYSENGRGKSTVASVLRSCSSGDPTLIFSRKTIDGTNAPEVRLQFDNGVQVLFSAGAWSTPRPELVVFDADFVEKNVYSGAEVRADQRQGLLEFALGRQAVNARKAVDEATQKVHAATQAIGAIERALDLHRKGTPLPHFVALRPVQDVDQQIEMLQKRSTAAASNAILQNKLIPTKASEPTLDLELFFSVLGKTLVDVEADAERKVHEHMSRHGGTGFEDWLSHGRNYENELDCPYCGQVLHDQSLIKAYRTYFNKAYAELKQQVATLAREMDASVADVVIDQFFSGLERSQIVADAWSEHITPTQFVFDKAEALQTLQQLRANLSALAKSKQDSPLEVVGTEEDKSVARKLWDKVQQQMQASNVLIASSIANINAFKVRLAAENVQHLQQQMAGLELVKKRFEPGVAQLVDQWTAAQTEKANQERAKTAARVALDTLMAQVLSQYQVRINTLLGNFGASFEIADMGFNYYGATPRTEYGLRLRGRNVQLSGGMPSFATALSEGDRRTLAFAFFIASVEAMSSLATAVVVVDDPMCSLDRNRRGHTRRVLQNLATRCEQIIVLGHDVYFLRDLRDDLVPRSGGPFPKVVKLGRVQNGYTDFEALDIDRECEATYYRNHRLVAEFVEGNGSTEARSVAKAIRPMLEGYLYRRFPRRVRRGLLFGEIVNQARLAQSPDPLAHLQPLVPELDEVNGYAGQFHHDTNGTSADTVDVVDAELLVFAKRALNIVHKGMP